MGNTAYPRMGGLSCKTTRFCRENAKHVTCKLPDRDLQLSLCTVFTAEQVRVLIFEKDRSLGASLEHPDPRVSLLAADLRVYFGGHEIMSGETLGDHEVEDSAVLIVRVLCPNPLLLFPFYFL